MEQYEDKSVNYNSNDYADSIRPVLDEEVNNGSYREQLSNGFTEPAAVYRADDNTNSTPDALATPISAENVAARAAELEATRLNMIEASKNMEEEQRKSQAAAKILESPRKELSSIDAYTRKQSAPRAGRFQSRNLFAPDGGISALENPVITRAAPAGGAGNQNPRTTQPSLNPP
jgi:hypothetical protein